MMNPLAFYTSNENFTAGEIEQAMNLHQLMCLRQHGLLIFDSAVDQMNEHTSLGETSDVKEIKADIVLIKKNIKKVNKAYRIKMN